MFFRSKKSSTHETTSQKSENVAPSDLRKRVLSCPHYDALVRCLQSAGKGLIGNEPHVIGVTSCHRGEGVTTVAINLTRAATKSMSGPILLVDANADRPAITHMLRPRRDIGLVNVLAAEANAFDCIVDSPIEGVSIMPYGNLPEGQQPAYDPTSIEEVLDSLKHVFPLVVLDLPPASELTACLALAARLDGVLMVVESDRVKDDEARRAKQQLQNSGARMLGVVLNKQGRY